jgi:hypothetical protein
MIATLEVGVFLNTSMLYAVLAVEISLVIGYHVVSPYIHWKSAAEIVIGLNDEKTDYQSPFTVTRIPIIILTIITLALNSNLLDGLGKQKIYPIESIVVFGLLFVTLYVSIRNFFLKPNYVPLGLMIAGLLFAIFLFKQHLPIMLIFSILLLAWAGMGIYYLNKRK